MTTGCSDCFVFVCAQFTASLSKRGKTASSRELPAAEDCYEDLEMPCLVEPFGFELERKSRSAVLIEQSPEMSDDDEEDTGVWVGDCHFKSKTWVAPDVAQPESLGQDMTPEQARWLPMRGLASQDECGCLEETLSGRVILTPTSPDASIGRLARSMRGTENEKDEDAVSVDDAPQKMPSLSKLDGLWEDPSGKKQHINAVLLKGHKKSKGLFKKLLCGPFSGTGAMENHLPPMSMMKVKGNKLVLRDSRHEYSATLNSKGQLVWNDGDVWSRPGSKQDEVSRASSRYLPQRIALG
jgi:hypothetical protein